MSGQSKLASFVEALTNTEIGLVIAFTAQHILFKCYDIHASNVQTAWITFWITLVSVTRSYCLRRLFNKRK